MIVSRTKVKAIAKSAYAEAVDAVQGALRPFLKENRFRVRGRTYNRRTEDGLTQVVNIQMGRSDPPGTTYIPGLRENLHGLFTINLGVYVPEVARHHGGGGEAKSWVQEYYCCVRARVGETCGKEKEDLWWHARVDDAVITDVRRRLELGGIPFLDRFATRDRILSEWSGLSDNMGASSPPRIVMAIILAVRGQTEGAHELLSQQALEPKHHPKHAAYVHQLADDLKLGSLDN